MMLTSFKKIQKKEIIAFLIALAIFLVFFLGYPSGEIASACVDNATGNLAFFIPGIYPEVWVYDNTGNFIYRKVFESNGKVGRVWYEDQILHIVFDNTKKIIKLSPEGVILDETSCSDLSEHPAWSQEWKKRGNRYIIVWNDVTYMYDYSNYFSLRFGNARRTISVTKQTGEKLIIWQSKGNFGT